MLPKGQFDLGKMPRFGLPEFADRFPSETEKIEIALGGALENTCLITNEWKTLPRHRQVSDFHCVTTWSASGLEWEGVLFRDFYEQIVIPQCKPEDEVRFVEIKCQDGYSSGLPLDDFLRHNVLLADRLNGKPLAIAHGAPLRVVAPDHYGYKNPKHINRIEFHCEERRPKSLFRRFLVHPRGRVALEERSSGVPGWMLRRLYRALIGSTVKQFGDALDRHQRG